MFRRQNRNSRGKKKEIFCRNSKARSLTLEHLEERALRAILTVDSAADNVDENDGLTTLREAIITSNSTVGFDTIVFRIGLGGPAVIRPVSPLPAIVDSVIIDGKQNGFVTPVVEIDGSLLPLGEAIFWVTGNIVEISHLSIHSARGVGIFITGSHNTILGNYIGLDATGVVDRGNLYQGIYANSQSNFIAGNVISGNDANGIWIDTTFGALNSITNNFIGTDWSGAFPIPNGLNGVLVTVGDGNSITNNVISGNGNTGVWISNSVGNRIISNLIGTNSVGANFLGNASSGVRLTDAAAGNKISGNVISNNGGHGVEIYSGAFSNEIFSNVIGLASDGVRPLGNRLAGVYDGAGLNIIGGEDRSFKNLISSNLGSGIWVNASESVVANNFVGTDISGDLARGNSESGILVTGSRNRVLSNVTSGNSFHGVAVVGASSTGNTITSNLIGTNSAGNSAIRNAFQSIFLSGNSNTIADNVISGSGGNGIRIDGGSSNRIERNKIGTNLLGTAALGNAVNGILVWLGASNNIIQDNTISANANTGIWVLGADVVGNRIQGNRVGVSSTGNSRIGNASSGIRLTDSTRGNRVSGNVISGNGGYGVELYNAANGNQIDSNYIGLAQDGTTALGNTLAGVYDGAGGNTIGGIDSSFRNIISSNLGSGVLVNASGSVVENNFVGTDVSGSLARGNAESGIFVAGSNNRIRANVSAGNAFHGVAIVGPTSTGNVIEANLIGTNAAGTIAIQNLFQSIFLSGNSNTIADNVISGSGGNGIRIDGGSSNRIERNKIGTNLLGTAALGNAVNGILVWLGASNNIIQDNTISANANTGIWVLGADVVGNRIQGNRVGVSSTGNSRIGNASSGIRLTDSTRGNRVSGNVISGNGGYGVELYNAANGNQIDSNYIGLAQDGTTALGNTLAGVYDGAGGNTIGGIDSSFRNIISSNRGSGVLVNASGSVVENNFVGTDVSGSLARGNAESGIFVAGSNHRIRANVSSGNAFHGVAIVGTTSTGNVIEANLIGTNAAGTIAIQNLFQSIFLSGNSNTIADNVISGSGGNGIRIDGGSSNRIERNKIGTNLLGTVALGNAVNGILVWLGASNNVIKDNTISANGNNGVWMLGADVVGNRVEGNRVGLTSNGNSALGNAASGIRISDGANRNTVGSNNDGDSDASERNVISGNRGEGIELYGVGTTSNVVYGNVVGLNATGNALVGNLQNGIAVSLGASNNTIGGLSGTQRNIISGNTRDGVRLAGSESGFNTVFGNFIGTDSSGLVDLGNRGHGLNIDSDSNLISTNVIAGNDGSGIVFNSADKNIVLANTIGLGTDGSTPLGHPGVGIFITGSGNQIGRGLATGNLISSNAFSGIEINGIGSTRNLVQGNLIGTDRSGGLSRGNGSPSSVNTTGGVLITNGAADNWVGTDTDGNSDGQEGNIISGNLTQGVHLLSTTGNRIAGNRIGTDLAGVTALANAGSGVRINRSNINVVGGSRLEARNLISGNAQSGLLVETSNNNEITGNYIGANLSGNAAIPNALDGIRMQGTSAGNKIGGPTSIPGTGLGNLISGNNQRGVAMFSASINNTIQGNIVGLNAAGTGRLRNNFQGIEINNTNQVIVGGSSPELRNVISANSGSLGAILISGGNSTVVQGNYVGTDISGNVALGNAFDGINIVGASNNLIGGDQPASGNVIAGNQRDGIWIQDAIAFFGLNREARNNVVKNNAIGMAQNGQELGNQRNGIFVSDGADGSLIENNTISNNLGSGILMTGTATIQNRVRSNAIFQNRGLGIDLDGDGVSANDLNDGDTGANLKLNFPVIRKVVTGSSTQVAGIYQGNPSATFVLEFFANTQVDESGFGEGKRSLGSINLTTDASGVGNFDVQLTATTLTSEIVTATASDSAGNTSEFSRALGFDRTPPTSRVNPLPVQATSLSIPISITGSDPDSIVSPASGVESYAIYVSVGDQPPTLWKSIPASSPTAIFQAESDRSYSFYAIARDWAGNVESKLITAEAATYVPDLSPPTTRAAFVDSSSATFRIDLTGSDVGSSGLNSFDVFVQIDGAAPVSIGTLPAGLPAQDGSHRASMTFQAIADGQSHSYRFFSVGKDRRGNVEAAPLNPLDDVFINATFQSSADLAITTFDVQKGANQRSYIRYLDVGVNTTLGVDALLATMKDADGSNDRVRLRKFATTGAGPGTPVSLDGKLNFNAVDKVIQIDFGASGIGGDPASLGANGYYALEFDLNGDSVFESFRNFYRLLGETNGDRVVNQTDYRAVQNGFRNSYSGPNLDEDLDGDQVVRLNDVKLAQLGLGRSISLSLHLDD